MVKKIISTFLAVALLVSYQIMPMAADDIQVKSNEIPQQQDDLGHKEQSISEPAEEETKADEKAAEEIPKENDIMQISGQPNVLIDEQYGAQANKAYHFEQFSLGALGWSETEKNGGVGEFSAKTGNLIIKKTSAAKSGDGSLVYDVNKQFTHTDYSWKGDDRVSVRSGNFKGNYSVELTGTFNQTGSQVYYDILGKDNTGKECSVGRYRIDPGTSGEFSVYNNKLNGANTNKYPLWTNPQTKRTITTTLDSETSTFQTFVNGSAAPSATTISGAVPADTFSMTDWNTKNPGAYITGIRISAQAQAPANTTVANIESVKLIENSKVDDIVDAAVEAMSMDMLTDTPGSVEEDLKPLPSTVEGANVSWTSSQPEYLSNDGAFLKEMLVPFDVIMTAKVTNPYDGFTKYMDFRVTLSAGNVNAGIADNFMTDFVGEPSYNGNAGTIGTPILPGWTFSYEGAQNDEPHNSQILVHNNSLILRKISDRQTPNYGECLSAIKEISGSSETFHDNNSNSGMQFGFKGRANGTGKLTVELLEQNKKPLFRIQLDASTKKIYLNRKEGETEGYTIENIDPTVEHSYLLDNYRGWHLYIDGNDLYENDNMVQINPLINEPDTRVSFCKISISNITYADTNMGFINNIGYNETILSVTPTLDKEKQWLDQYMSSKTIVKNKIDLPDVVSEGTTVTWTSSNPSILSNIGIVNTENISGKTEVVTLTAQISNGSNTITVPYTVTVYNTGIWKTTKLFKTTYGGTEFYSNILDHGYLYKGSSAVYQNLSTWLAVCGSELYFNANGLKKMNCATGEVTSVLDSVNPYYIVSDGMSVYYSNWRDGGRIYRYRVSDGANEKVCNDVGYDLELNGEYIYYQNGLDNMQQYKVLKSATNAAAGEKQIQGEV